MTRKTARYEKIYQHWFTAYVLCVWNYNGEELEFETVARHGIIKYTGQLGASHAAGNLRFFNAVVTAAQPEYFN